MSALLKKTYEPAKEEGGDESDQEPQEMLLGTLLQTTRDVAGMVVRPFAEEGDGVGAWRALISRYGNDSVELRQARQVEYQKMLEDVQCISRDKILDTIHMAQHLFTELDKLECCLPDSHKKNYLLLRIKDVAPEIYASVAKDTDVGYIETASTIKKLAALNGAIDKEKGEQRVPMGSFFSKMGEKKTKGTSSTQQKNPLTALSRQ